LPVSPKRTKNFHGSGGIEIVIAPNAGACFGVVRAIKLGHQAAKRSSEEAVQAFGPLVHNPKSIQDLESKGVEIVEDPDDIRSGTVILRSHGVKQEIEAEFKRRGVKVVDATCPLVKKPQRIASSLGQKGYFLILVGNADHPEVKGVLSYFAKPNYLVTYNPKDLDRIPFNTKVGILAQTTIEFKVLDEIEKAARARFKEVVLYNTICDATSIRQEEATILAQEADVMIVVGGKNSSNTTKLVKICKSYQPSTFWIEEKTEIDPTWLQQKRKIGITGGASTPQEYVDEVGDYIARLIESEIDMVIPASNLTPIEEAYGTD
ncbi:MAG: 4-hydroxy-3-methylbut-2-enyl diphosphate reductase, partial [Pseudomonadota bacterium]